jgi:hypothetical protein
VVEDEEHRGLRRPREAGERLERVEGGDGGVARDRHAAQVIGRVDEVDDHVGVGDRLLRGVSHRLVEGVARLEEPGGVEEDELRLLVGEDPDDAFARGLRLRGDDREPLADEAIEQGRLAGVGLADEGDESCAGGWARVGQRVSPCG